MASSQKYTYEQLIQAMQDAGYTPLTDAEITDRAQNQYAPQYNQNKLSAEQAAQKQQLALDQQLASLQASYDKQRETTAEGYANTRSAADRQSLSRGMQRSTYNNQVLSNIDIAGQKAQSELGDAQRRDETSIGQNKTLIADQLAEYIRQLETDRAQNEAAYADALRDKDYERANAARQYQNQLQQELYALSQQEEQLRIQNEQWEKEFSYTQQRNAVTDSQWYQQFQASSEQWAQQFSESQRQFNESLAAQQPKTTTTKKSTQPAQEPQQPQQSAFSSFLSKLSSGVGNLVNTVSSSVAKKQEEEKKKSGFSFILNDR